MHIHHHHHTYHHNHPTQPSPSSPHAQQFPRQPRSTRPYYHPAMPPVPVPGRPAFGYVYPPRPFIAPIPVPVGAAFGGPFFFPFPGQSFSWGGRPEGGGQEDQDEKDLEDRERAFPPSGPRLFNGVHVPPQAYPRGTRAGFNGTRPADRGRNDPQARSRGGFEVHHPDGTVEYEEEEGPRVEEMPLEGEDTWETARARYRQEREDTAGGEYGEVGSGKGVQEEQLMIQWDGATALPPPSSPIVLAEQDPRPVAPAWPEQTPASTPNQNVPYTGSGSEWQLVSPQASPSLATPPGAGEVAPSLQMSTTSRPLQPSPGTQAPKGTPEASPVLGVFPDTKLPGRGGSRGKDDQARKMREDASDTLEDPDKGNHLPTGGKLSSRSLPVRLELAARDSTGPPPIIDKDKRKEPKHQDTPIVQSEGITPTLTMVADKRNPTAPLSASLPSPEPAQVLDRLLEVTGLSARQFMIMLERGDFKVEDAAQGRAA